MSLRVVIEDLVGSAVAVNGHGEDLAAAYAAADGRLEAAQSGWQGRSAAALGVVTARWAEDGRQLVTRLGEHADQLCGCAREFGQQDAGGADALGVVH
jgi:uncharacterized protein YukE